MVFHFSASLWIYPSEAAAWHFVTVPKEISTTIKADGRGKSAWGSIKVAVTIGKTTWETSIFPESKTGTYLIPIKAQVRRVEGLGPGQRVTVKLKLKTPA